jgi:(5-formylfuran-3-yl)methyl phosphate transaminase
VFGSVKTFTRKFYAFALDIIKRAHVGVAPVIDFGMNCEGYLRFSYANSLENIREGMNCLEGYLTEIK